jgi:hypothetical protein
MKSPEEIELTKKKAELDSLSDILADKELTLEELTLTITKFQHRYYSEVGKKYVELDELRAQIADLRAKQKPKNHDLKSEATRARKQAHKSSEEYDTAKTESSENLEMEEGSEEAKKLYRKIASIIHPDKATDENSRQLRTSLMCELNEAYAKKDISKMERVLEKWQESPEAIPGDDTAAELVRTIRAIAQVKRRLSEIEKEISKIMDSDIHELMTKVHIADLDGRDLLTDMSAGIAFEIRDARNELASI